MSGFSFGLDEAKIFATLGELLGDYVGRKGRWPKEDRVQVIKDFAPIKTKQHLQQFLGCANWVRAYLPCIYPSLVKLLAHLLRDGAKFPEAGYSGTLGNSTEDLAVKAIKLVCQHYVYLAVLDEAAATDGTCPLELLADSSGIAWGGSAYQMVSDLSHFKVLMTAGKGLTPAQQAWDPRTLELYAQLGIKRAAVACLGQIRAILWTDHANVKRLQDADDIDVKHLRWVSEIIADGSVIQSLSGRSAKLGDGYSRSPWNRDELIAQRTKDLQGVAGQTLSLIHI